jgi:LPXTG-site transpeptidase (sortase) family protein
MRRRLLLLAVLISFSIVGRSFFYPLKEGSAGTEDLPSVQAYETTLTGVVNDKTTGTPVKLSIPKISVDAHIEEVGMDGSGRMDVPKIDADVAFWKYGPLPGNPGNSVIAGHFDKRDGSPSVFYYLDKLEVGDDLTVTYDNGSKITFKVTSKDHFLDSEFPIEKVFGQDIGTNLNLITCAGTFDKNVKNYNKRLVVFSKLSGREHY